MRGTIRKWGNSASVRLPASLMQAMHLEVDQEVELREEGGRIVIEPVDRPEYRIENLVREITPDNVHDEADTGAPVGREAW